MNNLTFRRALLSLSHPVSILGIMVLLLNDHWWRGAAPSWFTGKIGDFAWLIFAPFLLAMLLAWLLPKREKLVGHASIIGVGLIFGLAKTVPIFHALTIDVLEFLTGWPNVLRLDPTDLLALPALLIAWRIWRQSANRSIRLPDRGWVLLPLAVLATMADSPAPNYGIACLEQADGQILSYDAYSAYASRDGGLTWTGAEANQRNSYCDMKPKEVYMPDNRSLHFRFTVDGQIERSEDGGYTWQPEYAVTALSQAQSAYAEHSGSAAIVKAGPLDALVEPRTGNLVLALGHEGALVRTADGAWRRVEVGPYRVIDLRQPDQLTSLLAGEILLAGVLIALVMASIAPAVRPCQFVPLVILVIVLGGSGMVLAALFLGGDLPLVIWVGLLALLMLSIVLYIRRGRGRITLATLVLAAGWAAWLTTLLVVPPALATGYMRGLPSLGALVAAICGVPVAARMLLTTFRLSPQAAWLTVGFSALTALLFLVPFIIWTQDGIPYYYAAALYAMILVGVMCFVGYRYLRRYVSAPVASLA